MRGLSQINRSNASSVRFPHPTTPFRLMPLAVGQTGHLSWHLLLTSRRTLSDAISRHRAPADCGSCSRRRSGRLGMVLKRLPAYAAARRLIIFRMRELSLRRFAGQSIVGLYRQGATLASQPRPPLLSQGAAPRPREKSDSVGYQGASVPEPAALLLHPSNLHPSRAAGRALRVIQANPDPSRLRAPGRSRRFSSSIQRARARCHRLLPARWPAPPPAPAEHALVPPV